ncbi:MAG: hypothetical protein FWB84_06095 [Candidatus Bathyarchaeota archaeon]|uniref:hypothetical protein n=1 Tax=Candidatus Bathycorpusculum sp. TaxID=2994959 RepID=UPI002835D007|nr:hypothetical protein [Candidatus Termiticorpusculum sp.]MCL2258005.1 hypothetical protein [Candidatus Termiticorpusculum sp.]MCL2291789.1 hypothetical protein [Candidatus Termiticorpusculum sp.]
MSSPKETITQYVSRNYGHIIIADSPNYDYKKEVYTSFLRANYPLIIKNEKPPETKTIHIFEINNIGTVAIDKNEKIIKDHTTNREECIKNIQFFLQMWKRRAEDIVAYVTLDKIVAGLRWHHFLDPITEIISELWEYDSIKEIEIDYYRSKERRQKTRLYLNLLEGLEIVRKQGNNYVEGNFAVSIKNETQGDKERFKDILMSTIFKERYPTIRDVFKIRIFEPIIRVENCIYFPEIETEKQIYRSVESISREFKQNYHRPINSEALKRNLEQLVEFGVIEQTGVHFYGKDDLRRSMINRKNEIGPIVNALKTRA